MRFLGFFISGFIILTVLVSGSALFYEVSFGKKALEEEVFSSLISITESKANQVKSFLHERKDDAYFLAKTDLIKEILNKKDEYKKISSSTEKELKYFQEINAYRDLSIFDSLGNILFSSAGEDGLLERIKKDIYSDFKIVEILEKSTKNREANVFDIKFEEEDKVSILIVAPVFSENKENILGFVVLQINNFQLERVVVSKTDLYEIGESYLVNKDKLNITPLKFFRLEGNGEAKIYYNNKSREVSSMSINKCLEEDDKALRDLKFYENYAGDKIFGTYQYIPKVDWCVLTEINQEEFLKSVPNQLKNTLLFFVSHIFTIFVLILVISLVLARFFTLKKRKNRFQKTNHYFCIFTFISFFVVIVTLDLAWVYKIYFVPDESFLGQSYSHLTNISESRGERIKNYLDEREKDIKLLIGLEKTRELLKTDVSSKVKDAKNYATYQVDIIAKEVENYLKVNSNMTLKDLQRSREFRQIAVQSVGESGYSTVINLESLITYFHKNQKIENVSLNDLLPTGHSFIKVIERIRKSDKVGCGEGEYEWIDLGGIERKKYIVSRNISIKTADNVQLTIAATTYIDEYRTLKDAPVLEDNYFKNFKKNFAYHNLLLISPENYIVYMAKDMGKLGINLQFDKDGLGEAYDEYLKNDGDSSFFGPFAYHYGELALKTSLMSPVYEGDEFLGTVVLIFDMSEITRIASELTGLRETGENYLVNKGGFLISPLRFKYFDFLVQSIKTENLISCFRDYRLAKEQNKSIEEYLEEEDGRGNQKIEIFENYRGEQSIGTHMPIPGLGWCLLTEMEEEEIVVIPKDRKAKNEIIILLIMNIIMFLFLGFKVNHLRGKYIAKIKK